MPLSLNEIKDRALAFSREWEGERRERAEAQTFWNEFFNVFGISRRRTASFEAPVKALPLFDKDQAKGGSIDLFWRGTLIAEHKSAGKDRRRNLGAHYTSEENILKLIKPLFLDDLYTEFTDSKRSKNKLFELHKKISRLKFFDPACGCGNFLVIAYRELRLLELEILRAARALGPMQLDVFQMINVDVDQFYGIEIEEFPAQIAQVALWLTDHQMNMLVSEEFGQYFRRLPLKHAAAIHCGNALQMDWNDVISAYEVDYILGNPPFVGKHLQNKAQEADMAYLFAGIPNYGLLDYVSAWYIKTVHYLKGDERTASLLDNLSDMPKQPRERVKIAFVSTNSITQGEQTGVLWTELLRQGVKIHFAHRTFRWSNEARGMAAVHCVIIGFALHDTARKIIYDYPDIKGEPHALLAANINPYLVDAPDFLIKSCSKPLNAPKEMSWGNKPVDGGHLLLSEQEKNELTIQDNRIAPFIRPLIAAKEFLHAGKRWCLWLVGIEPSVLNSINSIRERVERVRETRLASVDKGAQKLAMFPMLFRDTNVPERFILIPAHSSETREYIPMGFFYHGEIAHNSCQVVPNGDLYDFGILESIMHMTWVRHVCGRIKSDYRYSKDIVYNNFPWPEISEKGNSPHPPLKLRGGAEGGGVMPKDKLVSAIEQAAQGVLDARAAHPEASLADLYDPIAMPPDLRKAHQALDKAVDVSYVGAGFKPAPTKSDAERVAFLFELYHKYTSLLPTPEKPKRAREKNNK